METSNGTLVLRSELANQLKGLQKSNGFKTPEAFVQHLFSLEEKLRTNRLQFTTLFAAVEQPWFENVSSNHNPGTARSVGVQVSLCCRSTQRTMFQETVAMKSASEEEPSAKWLYQRGASDNDEECSRALGEKSSGEFSAQGSASDDDEGQECVEGLEERSSGELSDQEKCASNNEEEQECLEALIDLKNRHDQKKKDRTPAGVKSRHVTIKFFNKNKPPNTGHQCKECGRSFRMKVSYLNHLRVHEGDLMTFQCKLCNLAFTNKWNLSQHTSVKHPDPEQVHKAKEKSLTTRLCHICGCEMKSQQTLKSHLRTHSAVKPYKCVHCSKTFKWSSALEYHIRTHTGERPHRCHKCGKAFVNRSDLTRHRTVHTGEKPHKCTQCDKAFTQSHSLTSHMNRCHQRTGILSPLIINAKTILPHQTQRSSLSFVQMSPTVIPLAVNPLQIQSNLLIEEQAQIGTNLGLDNSLGGQVHNLAECDLAETMVNMLPAS